MELLRRECGQHESAVLRGFLGGSEGQLERLQRDARTAEVRAAHTRPGTDHGHTCAATPRSAHSPCTAGHPHLVLHVPRVHLVIHTLSCMVPVHIWSPTPCPARSSCTSGHPLLALHIPRAHLVIHTLLCMLLLHSFACSVSFLVIHTLLCAVFVQTCSSTPRFAHSSGTSAPPHLALRAPLALLLSFACSVSFLIIHTLLCAFLMHIWFHSLLCTLLVHICSSTPCCARSWCVPCHPHLALHTSGALLPLLCTLPVHSLSHTPCSAHSLCTPALLCSYVMPAMPCTPLVLDTARP